MALARWMERGALLLLGVGLLWESQAAQRQVTRIQGLEARLVEAELQITGLEASKNLRLQMPSTNMFTPQPQARATYGGADGVYDASAASRGNGEEGPGGRAGGGPNAERQPIDPEVPGTKVLQVLYEAADEVAVEQAWDAETYDGVTHVFDKAIRTMVDLARRTQDGELAIPEAKRMAMSVQRMAANDLVDLIGEDGFDALKDQVTAEMPTPRRRR